MESKFIPTSFGKFHAQVAGAGEPVLLIHGYSTRDNSWRTWDKNIAAIAEKFRVYALDLLGYGEADKPEPRLDAAGEAHALVQLLDADKLGRVNLVGLSWGGLIAQTIAETVPERMDRLVLVDSAYGEDQASVAALNKIACPTLIVWDEDDAVIPVAGARFLGDAIPGAQVRVFSRAERDPDADPTKAHWSQMSHSRVWNRVVSEFLSSS